MTTLHLPRLIGLYGKMHSGKDTLGNYLVQTHGYTRIAFADALKEVCKLITGFTDDQLYGDKKEIEDDNTGIVPRELFQFIGTDIFRELFLVHFPKYADKCGKSVWVNIVKRQILANPLTKYVITDIRFQNELSMCTDMGGCIVHVVRPDCKNSIPVNHETPSISTLIHLSETEHDTFIPNITVVNNGTMDNLYKQFMLNMTTKINQTNSICV